MGPYCQFCDCRCFVPNPLPVMSEMRTREPQVTVTILATCSKGRKHDLAGLGYNIDGARAEVAREKAAAQEPAVPGVYGEQHDEARGFRTWSKIHPLAGGPTVQLSESLEKLDTDPDATPAALAWLWVDWQQPAQLTYDEAALLRNQIGRWMELHPPKPEGECYCTTDTCTTPCERCKRRCAVGTYGVCDTCTDELGKDS